MQNLQNTSSLFQHFRTSMMMPILCIIGAIFWIYSYSTTQDVAPPTFLAAGAALLLIVAHVAAYIMGSKEARKTDSNPIKQRIFVTDVAIVITVACSLGSVGTDPQFWNLPMFQGIFQIAGYISYATFLFFLCLTPSAAGLRSKTIQTLTSWAHRCLILSTVLSVVQHFLVQSDDKLVVSIGSYTKLAAGVLFLLTYIFMIGLFSSSIGAKPIDTKPDPDSKQ